MLKHITFTGVDNSIDPYLLFSMDQHLLSMVEWGVLVKKFDHYSSPRWPDKKWIGELAELYRRSTEKVKPKFSLHLCGGYLTNVLMGQTSLRGDLLSLDCSDIFERVQLNTHGEPAIWRNKFFSDIPKDMEVIVQYDGVNGGLLAAMKDEGISHSALFDLSHGGGVLPDVWPEALPYTRCGWAGGLGPDNLEQQLVIIDRLSSSRKQQDWVDCETKVRTFPGRRDFDMKAVMEMIRIFNAYKTEKQR